MTLARSSLVSVETTPWYHCVSRCVRRSFLCGKDPDTGRDFSHRKKWIAERIKGLASVFCVKVAAYAVMSNHYHVVLYLDKEKAESLSDKEVLERWYALFQRPFAGRKFLELDGKGLSEPELMEVRKLVPVLRKRLYDLSWYMRCLNEYIARLANREDNVRGRFWEGRFKSQALLDEKALLAAMSYVELNPVRAGIAKGVRECEFTSVKDRISGRDRGKLMYFQGEAREKEAEIPCLFKDYLELVEWTGRAIRKEGKGYIKEEVPCLLTQLGLEPRGFLSCARSLLREFGHAVGSSGKLKRLVQKRKVRHLKGMKAARRIFVKKAA